MPEIFPPRFTLPLTREARFTSRVSRTPDLTESRAQDQAGPLLHWDLQLGPLSDAETAETRSFYAARNGGYERFVFLDPLDNLLRRSGNFTQSPWRMSTPS